MIEHARTIGRTTDDGDVIVVRDDNGVVVVQTKCHGKRQRQEITVPAGWSVECGKQPQEPLGGEE